MTENLALMGNGVAMIGCWLVAGVFFAFSDFLMKSFAVLPPHQGIRAMQAINRRVYSSLFLAAFFAVAAAGMLLSAYAVYTSVISGAVWLVAGTGIYLAAVVLCTVAANVPMNKTLAGFDATTPEAGRYWARYLTAWTRYNHVRTAGSVIAALCFSYAFVLQAPG